jgi:hypothetical protein
VYTIPKLQYSQLNNLIKKGRRRSCPITLISGLRLNFQTKAGQNGVGCF